MTNRESKKKGNCEDKMNDTKTRYTPGPWTITRMHYHGADGSIADRWGVDSVVSGLADRQVVPTILTEPTARLIAAAPAMLAAFQAVQSAICLSADGKTWSIGPRPVIPGKLLAEGRE